MPARFPVVLPLLAALFGLAGCSVVAVGHQDPATKAEALAAFHAGTANFNCGQGLSCAVRWSAAKQSANRLLIGERWDDVADVVLGAGYEQDLTWFYLGVAAEGQGQTRAARTYYDNAVRRSLYGAGYSCTSAGMTSCDGIRLPQDAQQMLAALDRRGRGGRGPNPAARLGATGSGEGARAYVQRLAQIRADEDSRRGAPDPVSRVATYQTAPVQMTTSRPVAPVAPAPTAAAPAATAPAGAAPVQTVAMQPAGAKAGGAKAPAAPGG